MFKHLGFAIALTGLIGAVAPAPAEAADFKNSFAAAAAPVAAAPAPTTCTVAGCTGVFLGGEISGAGTGVNVIDLGAVNAGGTFMGLTAGYQFYNGTYWLGAKVSVDYQVASTTSPLTPSLSNLFAFEGFEAGGAIATMLNIPPINLPGPLAGAVPTVLIGACQHGSLSGYCAGAAAHFFIPNSKWTIDATYLNAQYSPSVVSPTATAPTENRGSFGATYHF